MKIVAASIFLFFAGLTTAAALAQSEAPGAPVINRVLTADFANESFTFHWRAPDNNNQNIIGYHIRRQQNNFVSGFNANSHPARCDELDENLWRFRDSGAHPDHPHLIAGSVVSATVFSHTEQPGTGGASHGSCYRWHIAAFTETAVGTAVVTNPILSRPTAGRDGCDPGEARPWGGGGYSAECTRNVEAGEWCLSNGGNIVVNTADDQYECTSVNYETCTGGGFAGETHSCILSRSLNSVSGQCAVTAFSHFSHDHRECVCRGYATPKASGSGCECTVAGEKNANCECTGGTTYNPRTNACECGAFQVLAEPYPNLFQCQDDAAAIALNEEIAKASVALAAEIAKAEPTLLTVQLLLAGGANPDGETGGLPLLITAALAGHAEIVSVLITAGADADARGDYLNMNIPMLMAFTSSASPVALSLSQRLDVFRHFVGATDIRGGAFDWNARDGNNRHIAFLLEFGGGVSAEKQAMANLMLARGMNCAHRTGTLRYRPVCIGGDLGAALANLINQEEGSSPSAATVRAAAQAMVDAGISPSHAGIDDNGVAWSLIPRAAHRRHAAAVSVLLTFGLDPNETQGDQTALHYAGRLADSKAAELLPLLRHFIGGLSAAGKLADFEGWNADSDGDYPLDYFRSQAGTADSADLREMHSLLYENGARCKTPGTHAYCAVPVADIDGVARGRGRVLTVSRAGLGFRGAPPAGVLATLTMNGWGTELEASAVPPRFVVSRARAFQTGDEAAVFTLTMTSAAGADSRIARVSVAVVEDAAHMSLVAAVAAGDVTLVRELVNMSEGLAGEENSSGVPLVFEAAMAGRAEIVSILITAGANPNARGSFLDMNIPIMMAFTFTGLDGTEYNPARALSLSQRLNVLRHFVHALDISGAAFDWNARDGFARRHFALVLELGEAGNVLPAEKQEMTNLMLARGMNCNHRMEDARYNATCIGLEGVALAALINQPEGSPPSAAAVRAAAQAMVDSGVPLSYAGIYDNNAGWRLVPRAAHRRHAAAISVLLTFGLDPLARHGNFTPLHYVGRLVDVRAAESLPLLRHFIGGLSAAGKLESFTGWNADSNVGYPLDYFRSEAAKAAAVAEEFAEIHVLFYEHGARCKTPGSHAYCAIPEEEVSLGNVFWTGPALTVTARAGLRFKSPLVPLAVAQSLYAEGWAVLTESSDELVVHRTRAPQGSPPVLDPPAVFTVTLTSSAGLDARVVRASVGLAADISRPRLISAALAGNAAETRLALEATTELLDTDDGTGVPLLAEVARLGHAEVVSILVTFGFDPDARHSRLDGGAVPHIVARRDGSDLTRGEKLNVLRHFGDAVSIRNAAHDWNSEDDNGARMLDLLLSAGRLGGADGDPALIGAMADYALARGGRCKSAASADRAHIACAGSVVATLLAAISADAAPSEIRAAAQAVVDDGLFAITAVHAASGELVAAATQLRRPEAVSILITFGVDPKGKTNDNKGVPDRGALHHIGRNSDSRPAELLEVLQHFIGGLSVAGKLDGFDSWNDGSTVGRPLRALNSFAAVSEDPLSPQRMIHQLLYERGARCDDDPPGGRFYCGAPFERVLAPRATAAGPVFTITARGEAGESFPRPLLDAGKEATLAASGWKAEVNEIPTPHEVVVSREAGGSTYPPAAFTVTLLYADGAWEYRVAPRPFEVIRAPRTTAAGGVFTITARGIAGERFPSPLLDEGKIEALAAAGWRAAVSTVPDPDEVVVLRDADGATDPPVAFTVTLHAAGAAWEYRVIPRPLVEYAAEPADGSGGTLSANVESGARVDPGATVTFSATPTVNFAVDEWRGATCAAGAAECAVTVEADVSVVVAFRRDCAADNRAAGAAPHLCGACLEGAQDLEVGGGEVCLRKPTATYAAEPPIGGAGTLSANFESGAQVSIGATLTFTATPGDGYFVTLWRGDGERCAGGNPAAPGAVECAVTVALNAQTQTADDLNVIAVFRMVNRDCMEENREDDPLDAAHNCGPCMEDYKDLRGVCLRKDGNYEDTSQEDVCRLLGGRFAENDAVCVNADAHGTFCILNDSAGERDNPVFPCRGLFRRVLWCNLTHHRPGLNPFVCGEKCGDNQTAQGGACLDN